ncbi:MAG: sigma-54 dependent transcriptional regulator [Polyangiales bacterium]
MANADTGAGKPKAALEPDPTGATAAKSQRGRVLVVDDEANARDALVELLTDEGYQAEPAGDGQQALRRLETFDPDVVLTDLKMPVLDGLALVERGKKSSPHTSFLVMTAFGSIDTAVEAIKLGAENYLTKPLDLNTLSALVARGVASSRLSREAESLRARLDHDLAFENILGDHPSMQRLLKMVSQVAPSRATVLIHGESGTGKELIASAIHQHSRRTSGPFVRLNCAALSESLLESELFGHEKGSFTGAVGRREGRFMQANGGTLFLDEVSEIPPSVQIKLLRFLQEREFERVGGNETLTVDVRVVAATNKDLKELVDQGKFREDLYYRLKVVQLDVPPLRVRRSDIPVLAHAFLHRFAAENDKRVTGFAEDALQFLVSHAWPGNVRELENAVERAVVMAEGAQIERGDFPPAADAPSTGGDDLSKLVPGISLAELERMAIERTLDAVEGSTARAAELLGISQQIQHQSREEVRRSSRDQRRSSDE